MYNQAFPIALVACHDRPPSPAGGLEFPVQNGGNLPQTGNIFYVAKALQVTDGPYSEHIQRCYS